jgi:Nif-specific regulatory protein
MDREILPLKPPDGLASAGESARGAGRGEFGPDGAERLLAACLAVSRQLAEPNGLDAALDGLLAFMRQDLGAIKGLVRLRRPDTGRIFVHRGLGGPERDLHGLAEGLVGQALKTGRPAVAPRLGDEPAYAAAARLRGALEAPDNSFVCAPIARAGRVLGCLISESFFQTPRQLDRHVQSLTLLADLLAGAVDLYFVENVDRVFWERRAQSLAAELGEMRERHCPSSLLGSSRAMQDVYYLVRKAAGKKTTVLLLGEKGVGKEAAADALHYDGLKPVGPLIKIGCSALTEAQAESLLFGRRQGAGPAHRGRLEAADGGAVFFDEIAQLPLGVQAKLTRVLKEGAFERDGDATAVSVDVRVIASSSRDLAALTAQGLFRQDFYYCLNVFPIVIPPLREREDDAATLARHFLAKFVRLTGKSLAGLSPSALVALRAHSWPGNVRELEKAMLRAVVLAEGRLVQPHDLPWSVRQSAQTEGLDARLASVEHEILTEALRRRRGNISAAAQDLGLTRRSLGLRMKRLELGYKQFRQTDGQRCGAPEAER